MKNSLEQDCKTEKNEESMYPIQIARIAMCMVNVAYTSLNIMSIDVPKQVFVWPNKFLKDFFPECKKIEDFLLIMYKFSQLFTVFDLSEVK